MQYQRLTRISPWHLTHREAKIMDLLVTMGFTKDVAKELDVANRNVDNALTGIYKLMGIPGNRVVACVMWSRWRANNPVGENK